MQFFQRAAGGIALAIAGSALAQAPSFTLIEPASGYESSKTYGDLCRRDGCGRGELLTHDRPATGLLLEQQRRTHRFWAATWAAREYARRGHIRGWPSLGR